jgi:hypothetical protein
MKITQEWYFMCALCVACMWYDIVSSLSYSVTAFFKVFLYSMGSKIDKITRLFDKVEHLKNWGVACWTERNRPVVVQIIGQLKNQSIIWTTGGPILLVQEVTPWFLRCSTSSNNFDDFIYFTSHAISIVFF